MAFLALTITITVNASVLLIISVPMWAMCFCSHLITPYPPNPDPTSNILATGDRFQMVGVNADAVAAKMIQSIRWDWAYKVFIDKAVGLMIAVTAIPFALIDGPLPFPTFIWSANRKEGPESLL